jgi:hypothetical protein
MTTATWSSSWEHSSDATFRTWGDKLSTELQNCGLVQTADTGQINWTTVTRPGTTTNAGYEVFYLNDSLHATSPIYIKLYYGTAGVADRPRIQVEVGTGSNGSGTITGTAKTAVVTCGAANSVGGTTSYASYVCVVSGFVGVLHKLTHGSHFGLCISRTVDTTGAATSLGANVTVGSSSVQLNQNLRFTATAAAYSATNGVTQAVPNQPGATPADTGDGAGNYQVYLSWGGWPAVGPIVGWCAVRGVEFPAGTTFSVALVGSTARTYISSGASNIVSNNTYSNSAFPLAMLYE